MMETTVAEPAGLILMFVPLITFSLIMGLCVVFPFWRIFRRAGFAGALSLLMFIPVVNIAMLFFLAFARWPSVDATELKQNVN